jgi:hypothetical protein
MKHLRAIGKWWRVMIGIDPKRFCAIEGVTSGVGWWWGEVGGVVAGSDGAISSDGESQASAYEADFRWRRCSVSKRLPLIGDVAIQGYLADIILGTSSEWVKLMVPQLTCSLHA